MIRSQSTLFLPTQLYIGVDLSYLLPYCWRLTWLHHHFHSITLIINSSLWVRERKMSFLAPRLYYVSAQPLCTGTQSTRLWTSLRLFLRCVHLTLLVQKEIVQEEILPHSYTVQWNTTAGLRNPAKVRNVPLAFFSLIQTQLSQGQCLHILK